MTALQVLVIVGAVLAVLSPIAAAIWRLSTIANDLKNVVDRLSKMEIAIEQVTKHDARLQLLEHRVSELEHQMAQCECHQRG